MHHAEAVLLIHHDQAQLFKLDAILNQRVRTDNKLRVPLRDVPPHVAFAILFQRARQQHNAVSSPFQDLASGKVMLLRQNFRRSHQRDLVAVFNGDDRGLKRDNRLPRSHIALQQPPHRRRRLHVGGNFL